VDLQFIFCTAMSEVEEALSPIIIYCKVAAAYCSKSVYCKCYSLALLALNIFALCWPLPTFLQGNSFDFNKIIYLNNIVLSFVVVLRHAGNIYFILCGQNELETLFEMLSAQFTDLDCGREELRKLRRRQICLVVVPLLLKSALLYAEMTTYPYDLDNALMYLGIYFAEFMQTACDLLLGALANVTRILLESINGNIEVREYCNIFLFNQSIKDLKKSYINFCYPQELIVNTDSVEIKRRLKKLRPIYEKTCSTIPLTSSSLQSLTVFSLPLGLFNTLNTAYYLIIAVWDLEQFYADYRAITVITCVLWIASYFAQLAYYTLQCDNTSAEVMRDENQSLQ
jgi:hypothetical protein